MHTEEIIEEKVTFSSGGLRLTGVLTYPYSQEPVRAILLCSPHPHFAGNMDNNVITGLAKCLARDSVTLRFDYRGIGESQINLPDGLSVFDYWNDIEENKNYRDALNDVAAADRELSLASGNLPQIAIGYSFGSITAFLHGMESNNVTQMIGIACPLTRVDFDFMTAFTKPVLMILGKEDFLYSADEVETFRNRTCPSAEVELLEGCDHFFRGDEDLIAERVCTFIRSNT